MHSASSSSGMSVSFTPWDFGIMSCHVVNIGTSLRKLINILHDPSIVGWCREMQRPLDCHGVWMMVYHLWSSDLAAMSECELPLMILQKMHEAILDICILSMTLKLMKFYNIFIALKKTARSSRSHHFSHWGCDASPTQRASSKSLTMKHERLKIDK